MTRFSAQLKRLAAFGVLCAPSLVAQAIPQACMVFDFSFANTFGNAAGTVTGNIFSLSGNATGAASSVVIEAFPAGLNSLPGASPINAMLWGPKNQNRFTLSGGDISGGHFRAHQTVNAFSYGGALHINDVRNQNYNLLALDGKDNRYLCGAYGSAVFSPAAAAVPEPALLALAGLTLLGLVAVRRKSAL